MIDIQDFFWFNQSHKDSDLRSLLFRTKRWFLLHVPESIPIMFMQCVRVHYFAERCHCIELLLWTDVPSLQWYWSKWYVTKYLPYEWYDQVFSRDLHKPLYCLCLFVPFSMLVQYQWTCTCHTSYPGESETYLTNQPSIYTKSCFEAHWMNILSVMDFLTLSDL